MIVCLERASASSVDAADRESSVEDGSTLQVCLPLERAAEGFASVVASFATTSLVSAPAVRAECYDWVRSVMIRFAANLSSEARFHQLRQWCYHETTPPFRHDPGPSHIIDPMSVRTLGLQVEDHAVEHTADFGEGDVDSEHLVQVPASYV
eukprot:1147320-Rhodomonas_salina.7